MSRSIRVTIFLFSASLAMGLAAPTSAEKLFTTSKEKVFEEPSDSEALVYVVRPATVGFAIKLWAFADKDAIGVTKGRMYISGKVAPGKHVFWAKAENISALELNVKPGKTYYLKQSVRMGAFKARVKLEVISKEEWEKNVKKCSYAKLTAGGKKRGADLAAKGLSKARKKVEKDS